MIEITWAVGLMLAILAGGWLWLGQRWGGRASSEASRKTINIAAYREAVAHLERRHAAGELDDTALTQAKAELDRRLLGEAETEQAPLTGGRPAAGTQLMLVLLPVVASAAVFSFTDGAQHFQDPSESAAGAETPSVDEMVASLAAKLEANPDDVRGWAMLGRSYSVMERHQAAAEAFAKANEYSNASSPELLVAEAEALAMARNRDLEGRPMRLTEQALELDPNNVRALWLRLLGAAQLGQDGKRREVLDQFAGMPDLPPELEQILVRDFGLQRDVAADAATAEIQINVSVELAESLRPDIPDNAVLFVFAKALDGPPMPLAVQRMTVPSRWPVQVTLDDGSAMMEGMTLSNFSAWTLGARISKSGQAIASSGDWIAADQALEQVPDAPVRLRIDRQKP